MKTKKKLIFSLMLALALCVGVIFAATPSVSADAAVSGTCGDNLTWTFTSDSNLSNGTLTISGTGEMKSYRSVYAPWSLLCKYITSIVIENGVTSIGDGAFSDTAYYNDENNWEDGVLYIDNWLIKADSEVVSGDYTIKSGTVGIAGGAFSECTSLESVTIP
ncbi:MAG: leucine-rich repeat domain-containing protein, partial [Clostridia bacterium]|nr:leucine-rich repeat domain-containing protein [Clostridia bacterium]